MIRKSLTIALFLGLSTVGLAVAAPSEAHAQRAHVTTKKKKKTKRTTKKRRTTRKRTTTKRRTHTRRRSGVDVHVHVGSRYPHRRRYTHYRYHHYYPTYHHYRYTTVIRPRHVVVIEGDDFAFEPPDLNCPIRTDEVRSGLEQWCATSAGNRHGPYRRWYDDGTLAAQGTYAYDLKQGVWIEFHPNGAVREEGEFDDGQKVGTWVTWGADGQQLVSVEY
jgi:hypothetical protein